MFAAGDCFTLRIFAKPRLHIIVIEQKPGRNFGQVISVYLSSCENKRPGMIDTWTILNEGDHPYIDKKSFVRYQSTAIHDKTWLVDNILKMYDPISPDILKKIQSAFHHKNGNPRIINNYIKIYHEWRLDNQMESL